MEQLNKEFYQKWFQFAGVLVLVTSLLSTLLFIHQTATIRNAQLISHKMPVRESEKEFPTNTDEATPAFDDDNMMEAEQRRRLNVLDEGCKRLNLSRALPDVSERYTSHLIVDDENKILFNFIPKVSCTTWKYVFAKLESTHRQKSKGVLSAYTEEERRYRLENYRKAVFVREPITRLLSSYLAPFRNWGKLQRDWERYYGPAIVRLYRKDYILPKTPIPLNATDSTAPFLNITFEEFIQFVTNQGVGMPYHQISDHFLPQHLAATPCAIQYDFIGHYEHVTSEAPYMLKVLGVDHVIQYPPVHQSRARKKLIDEFTNVPLDLINRLRKFFRADYELFGYSFDDTLQNIIEATFVDDNVLD